MPVVEPRLHAVAINSTTWGPPSQPPSARPSHATTLPPPHLSLLSAYETAIQRLRKSKHLLGGNWFRPSTRCNVSHARFRKSCMPRYETKCFCSLMLPFLPPLDFSPSSSSLIGLRRPLDGVVWPDALRELHFLTGEFGEGYFDRPIDVTPLPRTLEVLKFGSMFNQSIDNIEWPAALREFVVGYSFDGGGSANLRRVVWPASLRDFTAPVAKLTEKLASRGGYSRRHQQRQYFRKRRKMRHDDCSLCAGKRERRRIDEFRQLGWVPKDCRIHDAYSPLKQEDGLGYYDDSCTENSSDDEEEKEMREAMNYDRGWGY